MRFRLWNFICGLLVGALLIISYNFASNSDQQVYTASSSNSVPNARQIKCWIEGKPKLNCLADNNDVYMPFQKFIRKQFDVYGQLVNANTSSEHFEYFTSYSKSKRPDIKNYTSTGVFGNFGTFNVEKRDRVKCMSGTNGLPMSTQWRTTPYFYPIQCSQFGLQHYSRLITDPPPRVKTLDAASISDHLTKHSVGDDIHLEEESAFAIINLLPDLELPVVTFEWMPLTSKSLFIFIMQDTESDQTFTINYQFSDKQDCLWSAPNLDNHSKNSDYFYSLGAFTSKNDYSTVVRDLNVDVMKALTSNIPSAARKDLQNSGNSLTEQYKLLSLTFRGGAKIKLPIHQQSSAHKELFVMTANWLLETQSETGGWPVPVDRDVAGIKNTLKAGWISAMGQGHGISVLVRAYTLTNDERYVLAAMKALRPFETESVDGGVRNHFLGLPWYEEYPTQPPSLVLNGFIYSLLGLYDLSTLQVKGATKAKQLFEAGLDSLRVLLPFYDTGRGSTYDLKHATAKSLPNLARPDYHKAHVYLLKWLHVITGEELFQKFSNRWYSYSVGAHAAING